MAVAATKPKDYDGEKSNYINVQKSSKQFKEQLQHQGYDAPSDKLSSDKDLPLDKDSFYFFSMHDYNKDGHLDGHELMLAFNGYHFAEGTENTDKIPLADLESMVDHALEEVIYYNCYFYSLVLNSIFFL